jgi:hypothetical protein
LFLWLLKQIIKPLFIGFRGRVISGKVLLKELSRGIIFNGDMENHEKLSSLNFLFADVSRKLCDELAKHIPNPSILKECRKQLGQVDKDIRRIQMLKDIGN